MEREKKRRKGKRKDTLVYDDIHWLIYALQNALQRTLQRTLQHTPLLQHTHDRVITMFSPSSPPLSSLLSPAPRARTTRRSGRGRGPPRCPGRG